jgi:hypothetical protein
MLLPWQQYSNGIKDRKFFIGGRRGKKGKEYTRIVTGSTISLSDYG